MLEAMLTLVQAFVSSRLDYCNTVFACVSSQLLQKMQVIQNAAARFVTGVRRRDHMTPVLRELHWLPVRQRIRFKTAVIVYKYGWRGGLVIGRRTCDLVVAGSRPGRDAAA